MTESLWLDEATTALVSKMSLNDIFTKFLPGDFHPPLYYILMKFWVSIFGNSELAIRFPSLIFAALTIYVLYKMSGKISALILATSPLFFYYAMEARMYTFVTFLVTLLVYLYTQKRWVYFSLTLTTLGLSDYTGLLVVPIFWIIERKNLKKLFLSHIPLLAGYLLWLPIFLKQLFSGISIQSQAWSELLGKTNIKNILLIPIKLMTGRISFDNKYLYGLVVLVLFSLFGYLLFKARREKKVFWLWLIIPIVLGIVLSFKISLLTYFRFLFVLPALCLLVASGIENSGKLKNTFLATVLVLNLSFITYYLITPRFHREDWKETANQIADAKVVFPAQSQKEGLTYYGKGNQIVDIEKFKGEEKEIYLSRYIWEVFDPEDKARAKIESLGYNKSSEFNFNGIVVWKYSKK